jgi:hypothetical protein
MAVLGGTFATRAANMPANGHTAAFTADAIQKE